MCVCACVHVSLVHDLAMPECVYYFTTLTLRELSSYSFKYIVLFQFSSFKFSLSCLYFTDAPPRASLYMTTTMSMYCACSVCPHSTSYRWYYQEPDKTRLSRVHEVTGPSYSNEILPGRYACRVIWQDGRTSMSKIHEGEFHYVQRPCIDK